MKHSIILALAFATTAAFSHPGKTDAKGGHTDSKTGKYHLHTKPEAKKDEAKKPETKKGETPKKAETPKKKK